jgi:hypothetical protein
VNEDGERVVCVGLAALVVGLAGLWATGTLAALLGGGWDPLPLAELPATAVRLLSHLGDPAVAWPAGRRRAMPGAVAFWLCALLVTAAMTLLALGAVRAAARLGVELPSSRWARAGDLRTLIPHRRSLRVVLVTMWNQIALSADSRGSRPRRSMKLFGLAMVIGVVLACTATSSSLATRVPAKLPRIPGTALACFHKKTHRFTAEIEPRRCEFKGTEGKQRKPLRLSVKDLRWNFWGTFSSRGSLGKEIPSGIHVRVFVFRRVECRDGRTWYSSAVVFNTNNGRYSVLRLPTCEALS